MKETIYKGYKIRVYPFNEKAFYNITAEGYGYNGGVVKSESHALTNAKRFINKLLKPTP